MKRHKKILHKHLKRAELKTEKKTISRELLADSSFAPSARNLMTRAPRSKLDNKADVLSSKSREIVRGGDSARIDGNFLPSKSFKSSSHPTSSPLTQTHSSARVRTARETIAKNTDSEKSTRKWPRHGEYVDKRKPIIFSIIFSVVAAAVYFLFSRDLVKTIVLFISVAALLNVYFVIRTRLARAAGITKMESVFPDFIGLMASNLRAGMTIDRALLLSSRKEFAPLDEEISILGKDIVTGREITQALMDSGKRIGSEKIRKTIGLIISGIRSGGNLAILLEETSENMRERNFVEKRAASNVLMYVIFIFFAVAVGSPLLFGLSTVLVNILTQLVSNLPTEQVATNVPFALTSVSVSTDFVFYFSIVFLVASAILASLVLGLVSTGKERDGLKYLPILIAIGLTVFFVSRLFLLRYFSNLFG